MSDEHIAHEDEAATDTEPGKKPWWKRWWGITLIVFGVLIAIGALAGDPDEVVEEAADEADMEEADEAEEDQVETDPEPPEEPEEEPEPEPEPDPEFTEPLVFDGSGSDIIDINVPGGEPALARFSHEGSANFIVETYSPDGTMVDIIVNAIGAYSGTRPLNFTDEVTEMDVTADGSWTIEVVPVTEARSLDDGSLGGQGDDVIDVEDAPSNRVALTHDGDTNFIVEVWGDRLWDILVNEIGPVDGTVRVPSGALFLEIHADGDWTADFQ